MVVKSLNPNSNIYKLYDLGKGVNYFLYLCLYMLYSVNDKAKIK